jgi:hypothetical protein
MSMVTHKTTKGIPIEDVLAREELEDEDHWPPEYALQRKAESIRAMRNKGAPDDVIERLLGVKFPRES